MKSIINILFSVAIVACISIIPVYANFEQDEGKARDIANEFLEDDGYTVGECIPTVYLHVLEDKNIDIFSQVKDNVSIFAFEFYDVSVRKQGKIFVKKTHDGDLTINSGLYGDSEISEDISKYQYDEAVLMSDGGDYYYCLKNGDKETVVPGVMTYGKNFVKSNKTECTITEFFNALEYRDTNDPYNPDLMGGKGDKPVFNYIGLTERKQMLTIIIITSTALLIAGSVVVTSILSKRRKAK